MTDLLTARGFVSTPTRSSMRCLDSPRVCPRSGLERDAARLLERHRAGDLTWIDLELAAWLGHTPARLVFGRVRAPGLLEGRTSDHLWRWGDVVVVRLVASVAGHVLTRVACSLEQRRAAEASLSAALTWARCPCPTHAEAALASSQGVQAQRARSLCGPQVETALSLAEACGALAATRSKAPRPDAGLRGTRLMRAWEIERLGRSVTPSLAAVARAPFVDAAGLQAAVAADLVAWALGPRGVGGSR
jgi:hypothetical protein